MDRLARHFLEEDMENRDLYIHGVILKDESSLESLNKKFNDYLCRVQLFSYIKKTIFYTAMELRKKESLLKEKEALYLNNLDPDFNEERINAIPDESIDFLEQIYENREEVDFKEIITRQEVLKAIETLTERQKQIIYECIIKEKKDSLVARELGISKQTVYKIKNNTLEKLRKQIGGGNKLGNI